MDKDDVYSFGVLGCEVLNAKFPAVFLGLLWKVYGRSCTHQPPPVSLTPLRTDPPSSMNTVLHHIKQLDSES